MKQKKNHFCYIFCFKVENVETMESGSVKIKAVTNDIFAGRKI